MASRKTTCKTHLPDRMKVICTIKNVLSFPGEGNEAGFIYLLKDMSAGLSRGGRRGWVLSYHSVKFLVILR